MAALGGVLVFSRTADKANLCPAAVDHVLCCPLGSGKIVHCYIGNADIGIKFAALDSGDFLFNSIQKLFAEAVGDDHATGVDLPNELQKRLDVVFANVIVGCDHEVSAGLNGILYTVGNLQVKLVQVWCVHQDGFLFRQGRSLLFFALDSQRLHGVRDELRGLLFYKLRMIHDAGYGCGRDACCLGNLQKP